MINKIFTYRYIVGFSILLAFFVGFNSKLSAQDCNEFTISEMKKKYKTGNFDVVIQTINHCLRGGFTGTRQVQEAYVLLAKAYFEIDRADSALYYTQQILNINGSYEPDFDDPYTFKEVIEFIKNSQKATMVTSVSKKAENVHEAPATISVLTGTDIRRRGYRDFEQLLYHLPGFDIARGSGPGFSIFYQRGYRSIINDRTLMLIDGVEENDLVSDNIPLSRQYPLTDIKRVEVVYGPSSTMYGANAYVGVINVITKDPEDYISEGKKFGVNAVMRYGTYNTRYFDASAAAKIKDISFSVTAKVFRSDERDFSQYPEWDYGARESSDYENLLTLSGKDASGNYLAQAYVDKNKLLTKFPNTNLWNYTKDSIGKISKIELTDEGKARAAKLDNHIFGDSIFNQKTEFSNYTYDWYVKSKIKIKDLTLGMLSWRTDEGAVPWYTNYSRLSSEKLTRWAIWNRSYYIHYEKSFGDNLQITNMTSYKLHEIDGATNYVTYKGFFNKAYSFNELGRDSVPSYTAVFNYRVSNQLRNELRILWTPLKNLDINSGIEYRSSLIQGNYIVYGGEYPEEGGVVADSVKLLRGGNNFKSFDVGVFSQATYTPYEDIKFILGGRLDYNRIRTHGGYGQVFNPRIALVYSPGAFVFKTVYAEAFKDASYFDKYATTTGRKLNNPTLTPEKVKHIELSAFWHWTDLFQIDVSMFQSNFSNVIGTAEVILPTGEKTTQFQPIGKQNIKGYQITSRFTMQSLTVWGNFTQVFPVDEKSDLRISDISKFTTNIGVDSRVWKNIYLSLIGSYVGERKTGLGTSGSRNPNTLFDPYFLLNSSLTWENVIYGISLQFSVENLLDKKYFVPGVREADGKTYTSRFPQDGRTVHLGVLLNF